MKNLLLVLVFISNGLIAQNTFFKSTDAFMKKYVKNGKVDYKSLKKSPMPLNDLVKQIEDFSVAKASNDEKKAFYINAYNVLVIKSVVDKFPISSPMDVKGFFDERKMKVAGEMLTLNQLENDKVRDFDDPRIHFVLVCAALGCPVIINSAYMPESLDKQLNKQTRDAINNSQFIREDTKAKKILVSEIFKWYEKDFVGPGKTVEDYVNKYREVRFPENYTVDYYPYDWRLNGL